MVCRELNARERIGLLISKQNRCLSAADVDAG